MVRRPTERRRRGGSRREDAPGGVLARILAAVLVLVSGMLGTAVPHAHAHDDGHDHAPGGGGPAQHGGDHHAHGASSPPGRDVAGAMARARGGTTPRVARESARVACGVAHAAASVDAACPGGPCSDPAHDHAPPARSTATCASCRALAHAAAPAVSAGAVPSAGAPRAGRVVDAGTPTPPSRPAGASPVRGPPRARGA